jgi:hypothetical protein
MNRPSKVLNTVYTILHTIEHGYESRHKNTKNWFETHDISKKGFGNR